VRAMLHAGGQFDALVETLELRSPPEIDKEEIVDEVLPS
jgi:hypothetical protein